MATLPTFEIRLLRPRTMPDQHIYVRGSVVEATIDTENKVRILHRARTLAILHIAVAPEDWELVMDDAPAFFS